MCGNVKLIFNPLTGDFQFIQVSLQPYVSGLSNSDSLNTSDLSIDTGDRSNDDSVLDFGDRLIIRESVDGCF